MLIDKVLVIASAIIKDKRGKVLILQRSNKSSYPGHWQLVEGKVEEGEFPTKAIKREIEEELGVKALRINLNNVFYNEIEAKGLRYLCFRTIFNVKITSDKITTSDEHVAFGWLDKGNIADLQLLPGTEEILDKLFD